MPHSTTKSKKNLAIPGEPLSQEEFAGLVKEAEKASFYSLEEIKAKMNVWKKSSKK